MTIVLAAASLLCMPAASGRDLTSEPAKTISELFADIPYQPEDAQHFGFASQQTASNSFTIIAKGAPATPLNRLVTIAYLRAAELGIERGWPGFRVEGLKRTAECHAHSTGSDAAPIFAGTPHLELSASYAPEGKGSDYRNANETFAEMRRRLDLMTTSEAEKQATVDWVFEYCATTGLLKDPQ